MASVLEQFQQDDSTIILTIGGALVFVMHLVGVGFFYGGLVKRGSVNTVLMQTYAAVCVVGFWWFICIFSLIWGDDKSGIIGNMKYAFLRWGNDGSTFNGSYYAGAGSLLAYSFFQLQFAAITPSLIQGAFTDRFHFRAWLVFVTLYTFLVYAPVAHWNWGNGFLYTNLYVLDFAGGIVVHTTSGVAGFTCILPQRDPATTPISWTNFWKLPLKHGGLCKRRETSVPEEGRTFHNVPFAVIGAAMLWFGWFGFNGCSAVLMPTGSNGGNMALAFSNTHFAACTAAIGWVALHYLNHGKWSCVAASTGAVAGLVAITPAAGYVPSWGAIVIGFVAALCCFHACKLRAWIGLDDALDVSGVHGVGGIVGTIMTGIFAYSVENGGLGFGALDSDTSTQGQKQVGYQIAAVAIVVLYTYIMVSIILVVIDNIPFIGPVRAPEDQELDADRVVTGEVGYVMSIEELKREIQKTEQLIRSTKPSDSEVQMVFHPSSGALSTAVNAPKS